MAASANPSTPDLRPGSVVFRDAGAIAGDADPGREPGENHNRSVAEPLFLPGRAQVIDAGKIWVPD